MTLSACTLYDSSLVIVLMKSYPFQPLLVQRLSELRQNLPWVERLDVCTGLAPLAPEMAFEVSGYRKIFYVVPSNDSNAVSNKCCC